MDSTNQAVAAITKPTTQTKNGVVESLRTSSRWARGWRVAPFVFGASMCDYLSTFGLMVNIITYLTHKLHLPVVQAANTVTNFSGMCSYMPLIGAFLADAYIGRYKSIQFSSFFSIAGLILLLLQADFGSLRPPWCDPHHQDRCQQPSKPQMEYMYLAFALIAIGSGGIKPNTIPFAADQFDLTTAEERKQLWSFFNWFYFFTILAILFSTTVLVYVAQISWSVTFAIPAVAMAFFSLIFFGGSFFSLYKKALPSGSPFARFFKVILTAYHKRKLELPADPAMLHQSPAANGKLRLSHSQQFRFLDKAAIVTEESAGTGDGKRLCRVDEVEEVKSVIRILPMGLTGIPVFIAWSQQTTFWIIQANKMNRKLTASFEIPPGSIPVFTNISMLIFLPVYDRLVIPWMRRLTGNTRGIPFLNRIGMGVFTSSLTMLVAGFVEMRRRTHPALSCFWLVPQLMLLGISEALVVIGYIEFFNDQSPPNMRSLASAVVWVIVGTGSYASSLLVSTVQKLTVNPSNNRPGWLANNPNVGHLDYFYWLLSGMLVVDLLLHLLATYSYKYTTIDYGEENASSILTV